MTSLIINIWAKPKHHHAQALSSCGCGKSGSFPCTWPSNKLWSDCHAINSATCQDLYYTIHTHVHKYVNLVACNMCVMLKIAKRLLLKNSAVHIRYTWNRTTQLLHIPSIPAHSSDKPRLLSWSNVQGQETPIPAKWIASICLSLSLSLLKQELFMNASTQVPVASIAVGVNCVVCIY